MTRSADVCQTSANRHSQTSATTGLKASLLLSGTIKHLIGAMSGGNERTWKVEQSM
jgi:hypothetical protein